MKHIKFPLFILFLFGLNTINAFAEYRAYELEIFDKIQKKSEIIITTFSPSDYILTNGGSQRIGVIIRASWMCYGDTSDYKKVCAQPPAINPKFQVKEEVKIILKHHITDGWIGKIENSFYRPDLKMNVYGVRFSDNRNLYARYYEYNIKKNK